MKSIDVRTVAVKPVPSKDPWTNLITSIFVSEKSVAEVEAEHKTMPKVKNERFAIFLQASPFSRDIFDKILQGAITFTTPDGSVTVASRQAHLLTFRANPSYRRIRGLSRYVLGATDIDARPRSERDALWAVVSGQNLEAKRMHYSDALALIKGIIETDYIWNDGKDFDVAISSGVVIESADFAGPSLKVKVKGASGLKDLQLNFALGRPNYYDPVWRGDAYLEDGRPSNDNPDSVEVEVKPPNVLPFDQMSVELIHRSVPLNISAAVAVAPLENVVEPFLKTFSAFCPLEDFKKMLFEPQHYAKQPDKIFENAVAWLLSLSGFLTISLAPSKGQKSFDSLKAVESGYEIGSADILAYEDNKRVLLVDCDIGSRYDEKIGMLIGAQKHFEASNTFGKLSFVPVLCTPKVCEPQANKGVVAIVDKPVLESIFEEIAKGNREAARDKIIQKVYYIIGS